MEVKLSIIVPIYNGARYLHACIDSIRKEQEENWELILVDDGSADETPSICDRYAEKDARIRVIHRQNAGVSIARNDGISVAAGKYIGFVDADDTIAPDMYSTLLQEAENSGADVVMCDATTVFFDRKEPDTIAQLPDNCVIEKKDWNPELLLEMAGSVWRCIYRRDFLSNNSIFFPVGVKFSEDRIFNLYAMGYANRVRYIKKAFYNRLVHSESCVMRFHADYFDRVKFAHSQTARAIQAAWADSTEIHRAYQKQFIDGAIAAINNDFYKTSTLSAKERKQLVQDICEDPELQSAVAETGFGGIRGQWILKKRIILLCLAAKAANWKNGR